MSAKPVIPRQRALEDVDAAIDFYANEAGAYVALGFVDALESAYHFVAENASAGSPRWAYELGLPGLRSWPLKGYPWLVFYLEQDGWIDVWRVLHAKRDIPAWLAEPEA